MQLFYKCRCHKDERTLDFPDRPPNSDIEEYIGIAQICVAYDHRHRSPLCHQPKLEYVKFPVTDDLPIGEKPITN